MPVARVAVLVEGESDAVAVTTLAARAGRDLVAEGVAVLPMGGVTNLRAFATRHGPRGRGLRLAGLYDAPAAPLVRRALGAAGVEVGDLAHAGFFGCDADLEDELLRALGPDAVEQVVAEAGEARSLRLLAGMPAQRGWCRMQVLHRFLGVRSGRKARYAALLVAALDPGRAPAPLRALLDHVADLPLVGGSRP